MLYKSLPRPRIVLSNDESESEDFFIVNPIFSLVDPLLSFSFDFFIVVAT